jgi:hypothetical protein
VRKRFLVSREIALSLEKVPLRKLLEIFYASPGRRTHLLRTDIRNQIRREERSDEDEEDGGGGNFQLPFWADAKSYVRGVSDLRILSEQRISKNKGRTRLYRLMTEGFLKWWNEKRRWRNEAYLPARCKRSWKQDFCLAMRPLIISPRFYTLLNLRIPKEFFTAT